MLSVPVLMRWMLLMMLGLLIPFSPAEEAAADHPESVNALAQRMATHVQALTTDTEQYRRRVQRECRNLPQGDLFPYVMPLYMTANHRLAGAEEPLLQPAVAKALLDEALTATARLTRARGGDLHNLNDYAAHATYLGHAALALRAWRYAYEREDRLDLERHVVDLLARAMIQQQQHHDGAQLMSFPDRSWTFDTIPCALAILCGASSIPLDQRRAAVEAHLQWLETVAASQHAPAARSLPPSQVAADGTVTAPPRGCDLSWRLALLASIDPLRASTMWQRYREQYADSIIGRFGFREWPRGVQGEADVDSGPIISGLGSTATVFALAAGRALNDHNTSHRIARQVPLTERLIHSGGRVSGVSLREEISKLAPYDQQSISGFLYGDVVLAYAATWQNWQPLMEE